MIVPEQIHWPQGLSAQQFLNDYWQKKPLLIKQAFVDFETPITPDELAGLSIEEDTTITGLYWSPMLKNICRSWLIIYTRFNLYPIGESTIS